jgi:hypothetical protein
MKSKRLADGGEAGEPRGISGSLPAMFPRSSLSADQLAGVKKKQKIEAQYGPSQDERDRMDRKKSREESDVYTSPDEKSGGMGPVKMAKGGSASSRADGCAVRGKTKGRMV